MIGLRWHIHGMGNGECPPLFSLYHFRGHLYIPHNIKNVDIQGNISICPHPLWVVNVKSNDKNEKYIR